MSTRANKILLIKRKSVYFFVANPVFFSLSKKKRHRIKRESAIMATKNARSLSKNKGKFYLANLCVVSDAKYCKSPPKNQIIL